MFTRTRLPATEGRLVGAEGFEPSNTGSKDPRLTAWRRPIPSAFAHRRGTRPTPRNAPGYSYSGASKDRPQNGESIISPCAGPPPGATGYGPVTPTNPGVSAWGQPSPPPTPGTTQTPRNRCLSSGLPSPPGPGRQKPFQ